MKVNVIPDTVAIEVDIRTLPGEGPDEVDAHLRAALGDLADHVEVEAIMNDAASISRTDTPLWDALQRAVNVPFPTATLSPQFIVGFTDARVYRDLGAVAYGAGLFSPSLDATEYGSRFHGHNERIDVESLGLTTAALPPRHHRSARLTSTLVSDCGRTTQFVASCRSAGEVGLRGGARGSGRGGRW